jgi:hypothetical protein
MFKNERTAVKDSLLRVTFLELFGMHFDPQLGFCLHISDKNSSSQFGDSKIPLALQWDLYALVIAR